MIFLNIEIDEGTDNTVSFTYRDNTTNLPKDITGYHAKLTVRSALGSPYKLLELDDLGGRIVLGGTSGNIDISFIPADTDLSLQSVGWDRGVWDLKLTDGSGKKVKIAKGFITISRTSTVN